MATQSSLTIDDDDPAYEGRGKKYKGYCIFMQCKRYLMIHILCIEVYPGSAIINKNLVEL